MRLLDLFTGTGSVRVVAEALGYEVTSLDIDPRCNPDFVADITLFDYTVWSPGEFDVVWTSPPCLYFSAARRSNLGRMVKGEIMTKETLLRDTESIGVPVLRRTQEIIEYLKPTVWIIENPYTGTMKDYITEHPAVYDYCMFGKLYRKRTAIWSNKLLRDVKCDGAHLVEGRHPMTAIGTSKTQQGQGGGSNKTGRYSIPHDLVQHILVSVPEYSGGV